MLWQLVKQEHDTAVFSDGRWQLRLQAYAPNIIRVTQTDREAFALEDDPMITAKAEGALTVEGNVLSAGVLSCEIRPETGALKWLAEGVCVMREPETGGRTLRSIDVIKNRFDPNAPVEEYRGVDGIRARATGTPYVDRKGYQTRLSFVFDEDEAIYGLGQHEEGVLNYRGQHQFLYQHNLKIACPVIASTNGWAVFNNNCSAQIFHDDAFGSCISADCAAEMDYFVLYGPELDGIVAGLRMLTGDAPLLPRWALGYVQSKEHYHTAQELVDIAAEYRRRGVPIDCVVQDWQSWPGRQWGQKTADPERYPDVAGTIQALHDMNVKLMWSIWPNMNGGGENPLEFQKNGQMLGNRRTYDAYDPAARAVYWKQCNQQLFSSGLDAWWCDCTEPFEYDWNGEVKMFPEDRMNANVGEFKRYIDPAQILSYSINHSRMIYEGQRGETSEKRVVNLTRSGLTGQQRYGAICWNGDTSATWDVLRQTIPDGLNLAVCGIPYWTVDAGAFFVKNWPQWFGFGPYEKGCEDEGYRELYLRWLQLSAFLPMMRSHGTDTPREIWRFGEKGQPYYDAIEQAIRLRYRLIPYLYSEMAAVHFERSTMLRMLAFDFRMDKTAREIKDQFLFGRSLMIAPIVTEGVNGVARRRVYLPAGCGWVDFHTGRHYAGGQWLDVEAGLTDIPIYAREGSMVPMGPQISYADEKPGEITLRVYTGTDAAYTLYTDAGDGYAYEQGECLKTTFRWRQGDRRLTHTCEGDSRFAIADPAVEII